MPAIKGSALRLPLLHHPLHHLRHQRVSGLAKTCNNPRDHRIAQRLACFKTSGCHHPLIATAHQPGVVLNQHFRAFAVVAGLERQ